MRLETFVFCCMGIFVGAMSVFAQNNPPVCTLPMPDLTFQEDGNLNELQIERTRNRFTDPDGDPLRYTLTCGEQRLGLRLDAGTSVIFRRLSANFFTREPVPVIITVFDPDDASTADTFLITVEGVQDSPQTFALIAPEDSLPATEDEWVNFVWGSSSDPDGENLIYTLLLEGYRDHFYFNAGSDTSLEVRRRDVMSLIGDSLHAISWRVMATDGIDTVYSVSSFTLLPPLGVSDLILHPSSFSLSAFPNPFNSSTTITFSVGQVSKPVHLAIYDLSGRLVTDLLGSTGVSAGTHNVVWNAGDLAAGIYLIRLEADGATLTRKTILIR